MAEGLKLDFTTVMGLPDFHSKCKNMIAVLLKQPTVWPSADVKNDVMHAMPLQCLFEVYVNIKMSMVVIACML